MLYISLVASCILLLRVWFAAKRAENRVAVTFGWSAAIAILPMCVMMTLPAVMLQAAIMCVGVGLAAAFNRSRQAIRPIALASLLIAYGVVGFNAIREEKKFTALKAEYPFDTLDARLPVSNSQPVGGDAERLGRLEKEIGSKADIMRRYQLRAIHESTVTRFASSPGFGEMRMVRMDPTREGLKTKPRDDAPPQTDYFQPDHLRLPEDHNPTLPNHVALGGLHEAGILDFVNPGGFGYVKDRQHVAGFQSHGFSKVPGPVEKWEISRLELVGLLLHEQPVVYQSAKLPRMDELTGAPTRPLDEFEAKGLASLREGNDLHISNSSEDLRFLGAIRSTKQCIDCHGGARGALLGAFSYRLRPAK
ncbi:MAG TPA: hypothetical protein VLM40_02620 [Gemmata sp.]|nr:hypothetical protein [Gemmata sp.]